MALEKERERNSGFCYMLTTLQWIISRARRDRYWHWRKRERGRETDGFRYMLTKLHWIISRVRRGRYWHWRKREI